MSARAEGDRRRITLSWSSGVEMVSLGVETADCPALLAELLVVISTIASGLADAFNTFALGLVPRGAMFATTPCLSMPASAKEGRAGASWGSILWWVSTALSARVLAAPEAYHLSMKVLGLSIASVTPLAEPAPALCGVAKGLEYRDREARWVGSAMVSPKPGEDLLFFSVCDRDRAILDSLVSNTVPTNIRQGDRVLVSRSTACDRTLLRRTRWGCFGGEEENGEKLALRFQEKVSLARSLTGQPPPCWRAVGYWSRQH